MKRLVIPADATCVDADAALSAWLMTLPPLGAAVAALAGATLRTNRSGGANG